MNQGRALVTLGLSLVAGCAPSQPPPASLDIPEAEADEAPPKPDPLPVLRDDGNPASMAGLEGSRE